MQQIVSFKPCFSGNSYAEDKTFPPISLTSIRLNTLEKLVDCTDGVSS